MGRVAQDRLACFSHKRRQWVCRLASPLARTLADKSKLLRPRLQDGPCSVRTTGYTQLRLCLSPPYSPFYYYLLTPMYPIGSLGLIFVSLPLLVQSSPVLPIFDCFRGIGRPCPEPQEAHSTSSHPELLALSQSCSGTFKSPSLHQAPVGGKLPEFLMYAPAFPRSAP